MRRFPRNLALAVVASLPVAILAAETPVPTRTPTIDQSLDMHSVSSPRLSPDGTRVIYEQSRTDWESNSFDTDLWIANTQTGESHRLTEPSSSSFGADWSPDGKWIAFLSARPGQIKDSPAGKTQLYVMPADGGEAQQVTKMEIGVNGFDWSPDSKRFAIAAESPEAKAMKDRKDSFGDYQVIHADYQMAHLWLVDLPAVDEAGRSKPLADPKQLTQGDSFNVTNFKWSPDGKRIAFAAAKDPDLISIGSEDIYVVTAADGAVKKLVDTPGPDGDPHWSPDGSEIAFVTANSSQYFFYTDQRIAVVSANGGAPHVITTSFDEDPSLLEWTPEGIYFSALQKTRSGLFLADPGTSTVKPVEIPGSEIATQFSFSKDFKNVAYRGAGTNQFSEIYAAAFPLSTPRQITHAGDQLSGFDTAKREVVRWKSGDGTEIEGILYKPADFDSKKKYPLLVVIHGGPTGVDIPSISPDRYYPMERFIAKGALILRPNYRGSAGYGEKFRSLNVRNLGVGDYADVISGVDSLIAQGFVDKDRVGSMGWSEGGYISAFITTFK